MRSKRVVRLPLIAAMNDRLGPGVWQSPQQAREPTDVVIGIDGQGHKPTARPQHATYIAKELAGLFDMLEDPVRRQEIARSIGERHPPALLQPTEPLRRAQVRVSLEVDAPYFPIGRAISRQRAVVAAAEVQDRTLFRNERLHPRVKRLVRFHFIRKE